MVYKHPLQLSVLLGIPMGRGAISKGLGWQSALFSQTNCCHPPPVQRLWKLLILPSDCTAQLTGESHV